MSDWWIYTIVGAGIAFVSGSSTHERKEKPEASEGGAAMIVKRAGKYVVVSETTGRSFGTYATLAEAEKRLRQVEFFKHLKARATARGRRRASA
jgi:hypothetical protein